MLSTPTLQQLFDSNLGEISNFLEARLSPSTSSHHPFDQQQQRDTMAPRASTQVSRFNENSCLEGANRWRQQASQANKKRGRAAVRDSDDEDFSGDASGGEGASASKAKKGKASGKKAPAKGKGKQREVNSDEGDSEAETPGSKKKGALSLDVSCICGVFLAWKYCS